MAKAIIKLAFRQVIDNSSAGEFEKKVFRDSYAEFLLKVQAYNPGNQRNKFSEIVAADGRAHSLHYKCSFSVLHHIEALGQRIPGLADTAGRMNIPFEVPEFRLLESSVTDPALHKVAIIYLTGAFILVESFGEWLVLAKDNKATETFTIKIQPELSVISYEPVPAEEVIRFAGS